MHWAASISQPARAAPAVYTVHTMYIIDRRERERTLLGSGQQQQCAVLCVYTENYMVYISALQQKGARKGSRLNNHLSLLLLLIRSISSFDFVCADRAAGHCRRPDFSIYMSIPLYLLLHIKVTIYIYHYIRLRFLCRIR
jgi:hypothetical protein